MPIVNLGLLGASRIASKILPLISGVSDLQVAGVAAKDFGRAKSFASVHGIQKIYDSYDDCLASSEINAVYISVLNSSHVALVECSLLAGKHVLCEKPLVLNSADAERLFGLAKQRGLILLEGFMYRFHPQIKKMIELVNSGQFGEIRSVHVDFSFLLHDLENRRARATATGGGGALNDLGCYAVDFISTIARLSGAGAISKIVASQHRDNEVDLRTTAILNYSNGLEAFLSCSIDQVSVNAWEVRGSRGSVAALRLDPQGAEPVPVYLLNEDSEATVVNCPQGTQFRDEFENFVQAIAGNRGPFVLPSESLEVARVMEAIRIAAMS